jgi:hypothetical protein
VIGVAGGNHGVDDRLPVRQVPLDVGVGLGELGGELEDPGCQRSRN